MIYKKNRKGLVPKKRCPLCCKKLNYEVFLIGRYFEGKLFCYNCLEFVTLEEDKEGK